MIDKVRTGEHCPGSQVETDHGSELLFSVSSSDVKPGNLHDGVGEPEATIAREAADEV